jgi:16S rRNA (uracil1498-N3)-methyltransferase
MSCFYQPDLAKSHLSSDDSHHAVRVLRLRVGDKIEITDGKGSLHQAEITSIQHQAAAFKIVATRQVPKRPFSIHLAIAPTKNTDRMEWLVEKATEIGIEKISFIRSKTSERPSVPIERLQKVAVSAMKQSRQAWLPEIWDMVDFNAFLPTVIEAQKFIAHVDDSNPDHLMKVTKPGGNYVLLIGPEGDFTTEELDLAISNGFKKVSLGPNRLRTETAGLVGVIMLNGRTG